MPDVNNKWHYHMVLELIYFRKGSGTQYVGNSIERFKEGDVALIGKTFHIIGYSMQNTSKILREIRLKFL